MRPLRASFEIACRDTFRSRAASAIEIQSAGEILPSSEWVDIVNLFLYLHPWYFGHLPTGRSVPR